MKSHLLILSGLIGGTLAAFPSQAATFSVSNLDDSGVGSLRQAISDANATPGDDTIEFALGTGSNITLASPLNVSDNVQIKGPGADKLVLSTTSHVPVFVFDSGTNTLSGVTITNASASASGLFSGAGLTNASGSVLSLSGCLFRNNRGKTGSRGGSYSSTGGAIANRGVMTITGCSFENNAATLGGAIGNTGTLSVFNSTFDANNATSYVVIPRDPMSYRGSFHSGRGSALYNASSANPVVLVNCTFNNNTVTGQKDSSRYSLSYATEARSGAIHNESGSLSLVNCTLSGNIDVRTGIENDKRIGTLVNLGTLSCLNTVFVDGGAIPFAGFTTPPSGGDARKNFLFPDNASAGLKPLQFNGGPVETMALAPTSSLLNAGLANGAPETDARGVARPSGNGVDVGAYEVGEIDARLYSLSGKVATAAGAGVPGVTLTIAANSLTVATVQTAQDGSWTLPNLPVSEYTVTPVLEKYTFAPASATVSITNANVVVPAFKAERLKTYSLSGAVVSRTKDIFQPLADVTLRVTKNGAEFATTKSRFDGKWSLPDLLPGTYTVVPSLPGHSFAPVLATVTITTANIVVPSFVSNTCAISGRTLVQKNGATQPLAGVLLEVASNGTLVKTIKSDASGNWTALGLTSGTYTVTPRLANCIFTPTSATVEITTADQTLAPFTGIIAFESLVVTTLADESDITSDPTYGTGTSLREALAYANSTPARDTITFKAGLAGTIKLNGSELVCNNTNIVGPGAARLSINAQRKSRVLRTEGSCDISGLTLTNGFLSVANDDGYGGGILANGTLLLRECIVSNNEITASMGSYGGGLYAQGTVTVQNSFFSGNKAQTEGAGLGVKGTLNLAGSTFAGNASHQGSALSGNGSLAVSNCTFANNTANLCALMLYGTVSINSCTFSGNAGGTIMSDGSAFTIGNTLFNQASELSVYVRGGSITDLGYNLAGDDGGGFLTAPTNKLNVNAKLGPLKNNGGFAPTMALLTGSPAIDAGRTTLSTDQRGVKRPQGRAADIGAFEVSAVAVVPLPVISANAPSVREGNGGTATPSQLVFTLTLSKASTTPVTVIVQSANATTSSATARADYAPLGRTRITFAPGQTRQTAALSIVGDTTYEENERVALALSAPTAATLAAPTAEGTIVNDDSVPFVSINDVSVLEGNNPRGYVKAIFTISLSNPSSRPISVGYSTFSGGRGAAIGGTATTADADYLAVPSTNLTFAPGQTSKTIVVYVKGDTLVEGNDIFGVRLAAPVNARIADGIGIGTIQNDDGSTTTAALTADSPSAGAS